MSLLVLPPIAFPRVRIIIFWWYGKSSSMLGDVISNGLCSISFVAHHNASAYIDRGQYVCSNSTVVYVAACKQQFYRIAKSVNQSMYFCVFATA